MRISGVCPKCESVDLVELPRHLPAGPIGVLADIPVIRIVCCGCGYTELWIKSPDSIDQVRKYGRERPQHADETV